MYTTNLRKVGGSVMFAVPPAFVETLNLKIGTTVSVTVDGGRLVLEAQNRPRYTLDELLSQCDSSLQLNREDNEWIDAKPVGSELL
jgi:antitoxin ChpS